MRYIVIGLGYFGSSLSMKLTEMGHEVIAVDMNMQKVEAYKDRVTHTICLDASDAQAISTLPTAETDVVVVGIGEDFGASVMATAIFKQIGVKRLMSRAISPLHQTVLEAIGVDQIIRPEQESAERLAKKLEMRGVIDSFDLTEDYNIIEATVPERYVGQTIAESNFRAKYQVNVLTILRYRESKNLFGKAYQKATVLGVVKAETVFESGDILVIFGKIQDIDRLLHSR
ncbi:potassium channel family protein [Rufibacter sediminis]|uniref:TrkA family potassium uptake protein n=1 Tax=Rufibacter sediminis TaxID=2762756 RepID=A0ABR6VQ31_9BACT|nr:TrkA family potassium uptake protein [Rufibacter sediminis]MBC3538701.1 TrkA family potassium uptake protein [Rufibacter sediminis]